MIFTLVKVVKPLFFLFLFFLYIFFFDDPFECLAQLRGRDFVGISLQAQSREHISHICLVVNLLLNVQ